MWPITLLLLSISAINLDTAPFDIKATTALSACFSARAYFGQPTTSVLNTTYSLSNHSFDDTNQSFKMKLAFSNVTSNTFGEIWLADNNSLVLVFRGTQPTSLLNIASDIDALQADCVLGNGNCGKVHRGFQNSYLNVKALIQPVLDDNKNVTKILITGHSLGAAIALLASFDIVSNNQNLQQVQLFTFGQPKAGDGEFATAFKDLTSSIQNFTYVRSVSVQKHAGLRPEQDVVTTVPPNNLGFSHFNDQTNLTIPDAAPVQVGGLHSMTRYFNETLLVLNKPLLTACISPVTTTTTTVTSTLSAPSPSTSSGADSIKLGAALAGLGFLYVI